MPAGRAGPYSLRRQLAAGKPISQREPSLAHLAASNSADLGIVNHAVGTARKQQSDNSKADQPAKAAEQSPRARPTAPQQQPFNGFAPAGGGQPASEPNKFLSPFSQTFSGLDPMDAFAHLPEGLRIQLQAPGGEDMSRTNSIVYNQVIAPY